MLKTNQQKILNPAIYQNVKLLTKKEIELAIEKCLKQIDLNMSYFKDQFQSSETFWNKYKVKANIEWTTGFWTGQLCLAYEYNHHPKYKDLIFQNVNSFDQRIKQKIATNHHDMGFLYSLSCVSAFKLFNNQKAKQAALLAADNLISRYSEKGKFIQAWGDINTQTDYRLIIDSLLNIPLLFWASQNGRDKSYYQKAVNHFQTSLKTVIRDDGTTFHTYYFEPKTHQLLYGKTRQGYSDSSCWARGQAWAIYGIPLTLKYLDPEAKIELKAIYQKIIHTFINNVGSDDQIAYWDLIFNDDPKHVRDSSASAIAICGLLEAIKYPSLIEDQKQKELLIKVIHQMTRSLINKYATLELKVGHPLLYHGTYSWHSKKGIDEGNQWGDYFYLELLIRLWKKWDLYW